ncbi:MAG: hypothetical protein IK065_02405 [Neisseriaceae bacterium]|nr:hypothetical protein [Neisseriaceae bacterium]
MTNGKNNGFAGISDCICSLKGVIEKVNILYVDFHLHSNVESLSLLL